MTAARKTPYTLYPTASLGHVSDKRFPRVHAGMSQILQQQTGARRMAMLQLLARLIRITTLPRELEMYFAPILKAFATRLQGDKTALSHSQGLASILLYECVMLFVTRDSGEGRGHDAQAQAPGASEGTGFVAHDVGAAIRPLLRRAGWTPYFSSKGEMTCYDVESASITWEPTSGYDGAEASVGRYTAITRMRRFLDWSFEEIRVGDYRSHNTRKKNADEQAKAEAAAGMNGESLD